MAVLTWFSAVKTVSSLHVLHHLTKVKVFMAITRELLIYLGLLDPVHLNLTTLFDENTGI